MEVYSPENGKPKIYLPEVKGVLTSDAFFEWAHQKMREIPKDGENTLRHSQRLANLGCLLAKHLKFSEKETEDFIEACFLHDIGKTDLEDPEALSKPSEEFSEKDWLTISRHARKGYEMLKSGGRNSRVLNLVLLHHEFQEKNYPEIGVEASSINDEDVDMARLVALVDVFDRCAFGATNIKPLSEDQAKERLRKQFKEEGDAEKIDFLWKQSEIVKELNGG